MHLLTLLIDTIEHPKSVSRPKAELPLGLGDHRALERLAVPGLDFRLEPELLLDGSPDQRVSLASTVRKWSPKAAE
jgi:hypothetical protein